jgi:hypothetical protein
MAGDIPKKIYHRALRDLQTDVVKLGRRPPAGNYKRPPRELFRYVPDYAASLIKG